MSIKTKIIGGENGKLEAHVYEAHSPFHTLHPGLVTYNHPVDRRTITTGFFTNDTYGADQNQAATSPETVTVVHNGGDTSAFTASNVSGNRYVFDSTDFANSGTASIDASGTRNGDIASFVWPVGGSDLSVSSYDSLDGYIYITSWPTNGNKDFLLQLYLDSAPIGVTIPLSTYVDENNQDVWQLFSIPMTAFQSTSPSFDEIRIQTVDAGQGNAPSIYLDDIQLVSAGQSRSIFYDYCAQPGELVEVRKIKWIAAVTKLKVEYDDFFGINQLTNGYSLAFKRNGSTLSQYFAKDFYDMLQFPNVHLESWEGATETIYQLTMDIPEEQYILNGTLEDCIELSVRDDLSSLIRFRASVQGALITKW